MIECTQCLFNSQNYLAIRLNEAGICDICVINEKRIRAAAGFRSSGKVEALIDKIKRSKKGMYDCLIGISGGSDSTYMVYLAKRWGLNPLLFHVDGGWNSEISVSNIKKVVESSGFDYVTEVLPWEQLKDVQRSFVKANVIDIDLPFENLMVGYNYLVAKKLKIKYIFFGASSETEGIMPEEYTHYKLDKKNIIAICKKWGTKPTPDLPFFGTKQFVMFSKVYKIKMVNPVDWVEYNKATVKELVKKEFGWMDYGWKHNENVFTRFYQNYILPKKFNVDKRISHLSMLICSRQITKEEAIKTLNNNPIYETQNAEQADKDFFLKKLDLSNDEFEGYMNSKPVSHRAYRSDLDEYDKLKRVYRFVKKVFRLKAFEE